MAPVPIVAGPSLKPCGKCIRGLKKVTVQSNKKISAAPDNTKRNNWDWALYASLIPWIQAGAMSSKASELLDATATATGTLEAEVEAVNMGSLLVGDIAMLVAAPLVVYAALKMVFWGSQDEADLTEEEPLDPLLSVNVRSMVKATPGTSTYVSELRDPELQEIASTATHHIATSIRDAKETCTFQSSLHDLAVKHGGAQEDCRWIEQVLKKGLPDGEDDADLEADRFAEQAGDLSNGELCQKMTRSIAQQVAMYEMNSLVEELRKYEQRRSEGRFL